MPFTPQDEKHLARALELARQGYGLASPNPHVGAVIVDASGNVVGDGFHRYADLKHAEIVALDAAGERAKGATLYVSLEPCCHQGRTGPCSAAVVKAGIKRVVAAIADPNPKVASKGFEELRGAGVVVDVAEGALSHEARKINEAFAKYILTKQPLVTLKAGMTLDGKIAPPPGELGAPTAMGANGASMGWITSEEARAHVQTLRHQHDAILVGVGTVIADDPLLTDRTGKERRRPLMRAIVDSRLRLPLESRLVKTAQDDVIVFCALAEEKRKRELESRGVRVEQLPIFPPAEKQVVGGGPVRSNDGRPDMRRLLQRLGELEITSLMVEGGALINWSMLAARVVDKLFLYYAPKILAGAGAVPFAAGEGFKHMSEAAHLKSFELHRFGEDFAVEGYLKDPYEVQPELHVQPGPVAVYEGV